MIVKVDDLIELNDVSAKTWKHEGVYNQLLTRLLLQLKSWSSRGASNQPAFMSNC